MRYNNTLYYIIVICSLVFMSPYVAYSQEDVLSILEESPQGEGQQNVIHVEDPVFSTPSTTTVSSQYKEHNDSALDKYMNTSVWQFYIGIHGGGAVTGTYGNLRGTSDKYAGIGAHPVVGGILGIGIQPTPNFAIRLGVNAEHLFKMKRFIVGVNKDNNNGINIDSEKQTVEKTSLLGEVYFDFRSGLWSSFFIKLAGGYSWVNIHGRADNGPTAGVGLGLRWYAHKYITLDWTILDAKATFAKDISGDLGSQIGITFQY